jgi:hypothetical protein
VEASGVGQVANKTRDPKVPFPHERTLMASTWQPEVAAAHNALVWTPDCGFPRIDYIDAMGNRAEGVIGQEAQDMARRMAGARWLRGEARAHESALAAYQGRAAHTREIVGLGVDVVGVSEKIAWFSRDRGLTAGLAPADRLAAFDDIRTCEKTLWSEIRGGRMGGDPAKDFAMVSQRRLRDIIQQCGLGVYDIDPVSGLFWFELENSAPANSNEFHVEGVELQRVLQHVMNAAGPRARIMTMWHSHYKSSRVSQADLDNFPAWMVERGLIFHQPTETTVHYDSSGSVFWEGRADAPDQ